MTSQERKIETEKLLDECKIVADAAQNDSMSNNAPISYEDRDKIITQLGLKSEMSKIALDVMLNNLVLFDSKQQDYGSANISSFGEVGVIMRVNDKIERLKNLVSRPILNGMPIINPKNEPINDAWKDLANFGVIGFMVHNKVWK